MGGWLYGNNRRVLFRQNILEGQCVIMLTKQNKGFNKKGETECQKNMQTFEGKEKRMGTLM